MTILLYQMSFDIPYLFSLKSNLKLILNAKTFYGNSRRNKKKFTECTLNPLCVRSAPWQQHYGVDKKCK